MYPFFKMTKPEAFNCNDLIQKAFSEYTEVWNWTWDAKSSSKAIRSVESLQDEIPKPPTSLSTSPIQRDVSANSATPELPPVISAHLEFRQQVAVSPPTTTFPSDSPSIPSSSPTVSAGSVSERPLFVTEFFEVRGSPKGGYGAFALDDIDVGTVIFSEKPLFKAHEISFHHEYERLSQEQREEFATLSCNRGLSADPEIATFLTNSFATKGYQSGIFIKSSRFNHACPGFQSCSYSYHEPEDCLVTTARLHIKKGEELTIAYYLYHNNLERNYNLYRHYGFWCDCPGCRAPRIAERC
ncbi:hypothetical protein F5884DRAFT_513703 [Xylogone sp. PMI_703]|nr:hypothetical protein F5884DRAFT_513703 [Xylogone sp. PMI_703]